MTKHIKYFISCLLLLNISVNGDLVAPRITSISMLEEGGVYVTWDSDNNSAMGHKIILQELKDHTDRKFKLVNGEDEPGLVREDVPDESNNPETSSATPKPIVVLSKMSAKLDVQENTPYQVQIYAFDSQDGPKSEPWKFKLMVDEYDKRNFKALTQRNPNNECIVSTMKRIVSTEVDYLVYNTHF